LPMNTIIELVFDRDFDVGLSFHLFLPLLPKSRPSKAFMICL